MKKLIRIQSLILIFMAFTFIFFSGPSFAAQIKLAWDPNTEPYLTGYKIYWGGTSQSYGSPIDIGNVTQYTLTGLTAGSTYFVAITAYGLPESESGFSNEVMGVATEPAPVVVISPTTTTTTTSTSTTTTSTETSSTETTFTETSPAGGKTKPIRGNQKDKKTRTTIYMVISETDVEGSPIGNIKKYEVAMEEDKSTRTVVGRVLDSNSTHALDSNHVIKDTSKSMWSFQVDGREIDKGGIGEILLKRNTPRKIFTFLGDTNLKAESNAFDTSNKMLTANLLGVGPSERDKLIQYVQGYDSYAKRKEKDLLKKRRWLLGGISNSRPLVIPYENSQSIIFVGANDGMLHAFDDATGEELWGFIPYELLTRLKDLPRAHRAQYYVGGSPKAYLTKSQKIIVFGLGKGGSNYYTLDVTDPNHPKFLWKIGPETTGYSEMGQAWSTPQIGKVKNEKREQVLCFIGGGYDEKRTTDDKKGRGVYVVDLMTGSPVWKWDYGKDPDMKYSIPSDISRVDTDGDGYVDRLYVGDTGGRLWRFDLNGSDIDTWTGRVIFNSDATLVSRGARKIFARPDVTLEKDYEIVFFGTGNQEHPTDTTVINQIYAIKDRSGKTPLSISNLKNVTNEVIPAESLDEKEGWYINLDSNKGEKVLCPPVVLFGIAYFTTFSPTHPGKQGTARIYALDYKNGNPKLNLNLENDKGGVKIDLSDRSKVIGTGIPSSTTISVADGKLIGYTGIEGGVHYTPLRRNSPIVPIWWREVSKK